MSNSKVKTLGRLSLFAVTVLWGISFSLMKGVLSGIPPFYILAIRFCGSALILLPACLRKLKSADKLYFRGGALMGVALLLGYTFQTFGLRTTTPGKNAFLTSVYCVIVPFLYWIITIIQKALRSRIKHKMYGEHGAYCANDSANDSANETHDAHNLHNPTDAHSATLSLVKSPDRYNIIAALVCLVGIGLISLNGDATAGVSIGPGDALTLVCGLFYALHIIVTSHYIEGRDPVMLAMLQFATAGVLALICALITEPFPASMAAGDAWTLLFLTVVCTTGCLLIQVFGQKYTPPSQAAVILTLESVFGALYSVLFYHEVLTLRLVTGFALTFLAVVISETKLSFLKRRKAL